MSQARDQSADDYRLLCRDLPAEGEVVIVRQFITATEHHALLAWAEECFDSGRLSPNRAGPNRYYARFDETAAVPVSFWEIRDRAIAHFSITDYEYEPMFKCFLGCNAENGFVHSHLDRESSGRRHVRMNIMLSKPAAGGHPVVQGKEIEINERDLWCFYPARMLHGSTPVVGARKRFVLSIGILVQSTQELQIRL